MNKFSAYLRSILSMSDQIDTESASISIKNNIYFKGPNVIILICAIVIASIGLNVNSIPVIIGAMLISPLMGPIIGFGLGLGTNDTDLLKNALKNFLVMVIVSILASTLYFIVSPLTLEHPTELLARTNPTIYDVLIAFAGGIAGMVETCRKERGVVLSGVAIATALMPPLCTVGYSIANLDFSSFIGALYLFMINCIFIALATFLTTKYLSFPVVKLEDAKLDKRRTRTIAFLMLVIIVPSILSAIKVVKESNFNRYAAIIVSENKSIGKSYIYDHKTNLSSKPATIELFMAGELLDELQKEKIYQSAESHGITRSQIVFREDAAIQNVPISDEEIVRSIYEQNEKRLQAREETIKGLEQELDAYRSKEMPVALIARELGAQYSNVTGVVLTRGESSMLESNATKEEIIAIVYSKPLLNSSSIKTIENWLKIRLGSSNVNIINKPTPQVEEMQAASDTQ